MFLTVIERGLLHVVKNPLGHWNEGRGVGDGYSAQTSMGMLGLQAQTILVAGLNYHQKPHTHSYASWPCGWGGRGGTQDKTIQECPAQNFEPL